MTTHTPFIEGWAVLFEQVWDVRVVLCTPNHVGCSEHVSIVVAATSIAIAPIADLPPLQTRLETPDTWGLSSLSRTAADQLTYQARHLTLWLWLEGRSSRVGSPQAPRRESLGVFERHTSFLPLRGPHGHPQGSGAFSFCTTIGVPNTSLCADPCGMSTSCGILVLPS